MTKMISGQTARRRVVASTTAALCVVALLGAAAPAEAAKRWHGYNIQKTSHAAGGWIGGYKSSDKVVYRIDPSWKAPQGGLGPVTQVTKIKSVRATSRASWIVSKYGSYPSNTQAAAVDAALLDLLAGPSWGLTGKHGARRIQQSRDAANVRKFAKVMLAGSAKFAGPYKIAVTKNSPTTGAPAGVVVTVRSASGHAVPKLPVNVTYGSMGQRSGVTNASGATQLNWTQSGAPGTYALAVNLDRVPTTTLAVRAPETGSRVVVAGGKESVQITAAAIVRAVPRVGVAPTGEKKMLGDVIAPRLVVVASAADTTRTATVTLYRPAAGAAACTGKAVTSFQVSTKGNGTFAVPNYQLTAAGRYTWGVSLPGDAYNAAVSSCPGSFAVYRHGRATADAGAKVRHVADQVASSVTVAGLTENYAGKVAVTLYGPFNEAANTACISKKAIGTLQYTVRHDGHFISGQLKVRAKGFYVWRSRLAANDYTLGYDSLCGRAAARFEVR